MNKLYDLIWRRFVASQMVEAIYIETKVNIEGFNGSDKFDFLLSGLKLQFNGWLSVYSNKSKNKEVFIPDLSKGDEVFN